MPLTACLLGGGCLKVCMLHSCSSGSINKLFAALKPRVMAEALTVFRLMLLPLMEMAGCLGSVLVSAVDTYKAPPVWDATLSSMVLPPIITCRFWERRPAPMVAWCGKRQAREKHQRAACNNARVALIALTT